MTNHPTGILPDDISRDPHSDSWLIFLDVTDGSSIQNWLRDTLTPAIANLTATGDAVATVGAGPAFFPKAGRSDATPLGFTEALPVNTTSDQHDVFLYVFSRSDAAVAKLLRDITLGQQAIISSVKIERGYQRADHREVFNQKDGLRNARIDRKKIVFVPDNSEEPVWAHGGAYMTYLKIQQNVEQWPTDPALQANIIGRNADGTRVDTPTVTDVTSEGEFTNPTLPPPNSHIRKAGPRDTENDAVQIFRRGTPYVEADGGNVTEGLLFVSYEAEIDAYLTVLQRWMQNQNFPTDETGVDALLNYVTILGGGVYFALPRDEYIGAGIFTPAPATGTLVVRIRVLDANGAPDPNASVAGANFTITGDGVSVTVTTDAASRATQDGLPIGVELTVTQQSAPSGATTSPGPSPQTVTLERCTRSVLKFDNARSPSAPPGGYGA